MMSSQEIKEQRSRWITNARALLAETLEELELIAVGGENSWSRKFKSKFPGPGYIKTMEAQRDRLMREIERFEKRERDSRLE